MFNIGIDLGQRRDHTAIAVVERKDRPRPYQTSVFKGLEVIHVERVPLGTSYPGVVSRIREIVEQEKLEGQCVLAVDATGVGVPVVDLLRAARLGCDISAATITGGEREHRQQGSCWSVPKRDLIAGVQVLLDRGELKIARRMKDAGPLVRELTSIRATSALNSRPGRVRLGAEGSGEHDDLVIALALACWRAKRRQDAYVPHRLPGI